MPQREDFSACHGAPLDDEVVQNPMPDNNNDPVCADSVDGAAPADQQDDGGVAALSPHRGAQYLFRVCPWTRNIPVVGSVIAAFGPKFTASIGGFYFMNNGLAENIITASRQPMMMKRYQIDGTRYQRLAGVVTMGSSIKVLMAVISDTFAIFGYRKRWYQLGSCVVGFGFCLGYALLPARPSSADIAAAFIFLCSFCRMNSDILTQGYYSRLIRRAPDAGPPLVAWIYYMILIATLIAAVIMGPLADQGKMHYGIFLSAAMHLLPAVIFALNGYSEKTNQVERLEDAARLREELRKARLAAAGARPLLEETSSGSEGGGDDDGSDNHVRMGVPQKAPVELVNDAAPREVLAATDAAAQNAVATLAGDEMDRRDADWVETDMRSYCGGNLEVNTAMVVRNWPIVAYSAVMIACVITMACMTILGTTRDLLWTSIAISVTCIACAFIALPRVIAKAEVAVYLDFVLYIQLPGALDSFYVGDAACVPGGPQFSYSFYTTVGAVIQNLAGLLGVTLFSYVFSKYSFQLVMVTTVIMRIVASVFDLMVVERWNLYIGIPDHAMYICGDAIVYQICYMLNFMPLVLLLSRVVPAGSEAMVFSLMSSIGNLGMTMSNTVGSLLMELAWPIDTTSRPCDFSNVRWLLIAGHMASPLLIIPVSYLLLPRERMCDDIDMNGKAIRKHLEEEHRQREAAAEAEVHTGRSEPLHGDAPASSEQPHPHQQARA